MADQRAFKRTVAITIARPVAAEQYFQSTSLAVVRDLRVAFSIERTIGKEPNKCDVTIWNLSATSRAELQKSPVGIRVDAGYDGEVERLFEGDIRFCRHVRDTVDWRSEMQVGDGDRAFKFARVKRSYSSGVKLRDLVADVATSMGLRVPRAIDDYAEFDREFASGAALFGPAQAELSRVLNAAGFGWSIQDGQLQILRETATRAETLVIVSQATGMIGTPDLGAPPSKGKPPVLTVKKLLDASLKPGTRIRMQSRSVTGDFKLKKVTHSGDTHGGDWTTTMEGTAV